MKLFIVFLVVISFLASVFAAEEKQELSYYLIGNSLTWDTVPSKLDGDTQWHVDCGKSLPFIFENPAAPCVATSTLWPAALKEKQYDYLALQVHYGSQLAEDAAVIGSLIEMQPGAIVVIHTGWARSSSREEEYNRVDADGEMQHSAAYFDALLKLLKKVYPTREFRLSRAQDLLNRIAEDVKSGTAPLESVEALHRDKIHMDIVTGRYLMHNAMRHALDQPRSKVGFDKISGEVKIYLDSVLDEVLER
tara:strand:- start:100 stop:846 length:747 start_codon:yes stop_codon:yes gene_type:complete